MDVPISANTTAQASRYPSRPDAARSRSESGSRLVEGRRVLMPLGVSGTGVDTARVCYPPPTEASGATPGRGGSRRGSTPSARFVVPRKINREVHPPIGVARHAEGPAHQAHQLAGGPQLDPQAVV